MITLAALLAVGLTAQAPEVRPEIAAQVKQADALIDDLEEQKALAILSALAKRQDLASAELSLVELHRGIAFMGLNKKDEADGAFSTARGCNGLVEIPAGVSPKIRQVFNSAVPLDCPVGSRQAADPTANLPTPVVHPAQPAPKPVAEAPKAMAAEGEGGGVSILAVAGAGVAVAGGAVLALAVLAALGSTGALVGSYPLQAAAHAAEQAKDARQQNMMALVMRVSGAAILAVAGAGGLAGLVILAGGAAVAVFGFLR